MTAENSIRERVADKAKALARPAIGALVAWGCFVVAAAGASEAGVYRSVDGTRQFRVDEGSLTGSHAPGVPHVHLETYAPGARVPSVNNHIPFVD